MVRNVACAEARAAEAGLDQRAGAHERGQVALLGERKVERQAGRVYGEREAAHVLVLENRSGFGDGLIQTARAAGDDALVHMQDLAVPLVLDPAHIGEDVGGVGLEVLNGKGVGRVIG